MESSSQSSTIDFFTLDGRKAKKPLKKCEPIVLPIDIWLMYLKCLIRHDTFHDFKKPRSENTSKIKGWLTSDFGEPRFRNILTQLGNTIAVKITKLKNSTKKFTDSFRTFVKETKVKLKLPRREWKVGVRSSLRNALKRSIDTAEKEKKWRNAINSDGGGRVQKKRSQAARRQNKKPWEKPEKEITGRELDDWANPNVKSINIYFEPVTFFNKDEGEDKMFFEQLGKIKEVTNHELTAHIEPLIEAFSLLDENKRIKKEVNNQIKSLVEQITTIIDFDDDGGGGKAAEGGGKHKKIKKRKMKKRTRKRKPRKRKKRSIKIIRRQNKKRTRKRKRKRKKIKTRKHSIKMKGGRDPTNVKVEGVDQRVREQFNKPVGVDVEGVNVEVQAKARREEAAAKVEAKVEADGVKLDEITLKIKWEEGEKIASEWEKEVGLLESKEGVENKKYLNMRYNTRLLLTKAIENINKGEDIRVEGQEGHVVKEFIRLMGHCEPEDGVDVPIIREGDTGEPKYFLKTIEGNISEEEKKKNYNILLEEICFQIRELVKNNFNKQDNAKKEIMDELYKYFFQTSEQQGGAQYGGFVTATILTTILALMNFATALESENYINQIITELKGKDKGQITQSYDYWSLAMGKMAKFKTPQVLQNIESNPSEMLKSTAWEGLAYLKELLPIFKDDNVPGALSYTSGVDDFAEDDGKIGGNFIDWLSGMYPASSQPGFNTIAKSLGWNRTENGKNGKPGKAISTTPTKRIIMDNCAGWIGQEAREWKRILSFCGSEGTNDSGGTCSWGQVHPKGDSFRKFHKREDGVSLLVDTELQIESEFVNGKKGFIREKLQANESGGAYPDRDCVVNPGVDDGGCKYGSEETVGVIETITDGIGTTTTQKTSYMSSWRYNYPSQVNNILFKYDFGGQGSDDFLVWTNNLYMGLRRKAGGDEGIILGALSKFFPNTENTENPLINTRHINAGIADYDNNGDAYRFAPSRDGLAAWRTLMIIIFASQGSVNRKAIGGYVDMSNRITIAGPVHNKEYLESKQRSTEENVYFLKLV